MAAKLEERLVQTAIQDFEPRAKVLKSSRKKKRGRSAVLYRPLLDSSDNEDEDNQNTPPPAVQRGDDAATSNDHTRTNSSNNGLGFSVNMYSGNFNSLPREYNPGDIFIAVMPS